MAEKITAARPYAQAVFELAQAHGDLKRWSEMLVLAVSVAADPALRRLIGHPRVHKTQLAELVLEICGDKLNDAGRNFIRLVVENGRLALLPEIAALYEANRAEAEGVLKVQVTSAFPLSSEEETRISAALKSRMKREISLSSVVDKRLLGGAVIRTGDRVIDGSVRSQLAKLAQTLAR